MNISKGVYINIDLSFNSYYKYAFTFQGATEVNAYIPNARWYDYYTVSNLIKSVLCTMDLLKELDPRRC